MRVNIYYCILTLAILACGFVQAGELKLVSDAFDTSEIQYAVMKSKMDFVTGHLDNAKRLGDLQVGETCLSTIQKYANNFTDHAGVILEMVYNSGKDVNDLGKFAECSDSENTRYVVFSVNGLPLGIYLGI